MAIVIVIVVILWIRRREMTILSGRLALVTGGGSGIGKAVCKVLARDGACVVAADINPKSAEETLESLSSLNEHSALSLDVGSSKSVQDSLKTLIERYKRPPDILVNSAGITRDTYLLKMTEEDFDKVINVNLKGTYLVTQAVSLLLKDAKIKGASFVNISSVIGKMGNAGQCNYGASKAGVIGFTKSAAKELGKFGIRVNCICPGFIKTPMTDTVPEHLKQMILFQIPLGDFGDPEDIAEVACFLASSKSKYMTGSVIDVTGGLV